MNIYFIISYKILPLNNIFNFQMNLYEILCINSSTSFDDIKRTHRKLALQFHPDKCIDKTQEERNNLTTRFVQINQAFKILSDPILRKIYDSEGMIGIEKHNNKLAQEESVNEAKERNKKNREERTKRKKQKEQEELKKREFEEKARLEQEEIKRKLELDRLEKKKLEEEQRERELEEKRVKEIELEELRINFEKQQKILKLEILRKKKLEAEQREKELAEKRAKEIEQELAEREFEKLNKEKQAQELINLRIRNKNQLIKNHLIELAVPFKKIILQMIDRLDIINPDHYVVNYIISKFMDIVVHLDNVKIKKLYLELKTILDYFENDYNEITTKKSIRGQLYFKKLLNICIEYSFDEYICSQYEEYLKNSNQYSSNNFDFLKSIVGVYIKIIQQIIPDVYFL